MSAALFSDAPIPILYAAPPPPPPPIDDVSALAEPPALALPLLSVGVVLSVGALSDELSVDSSESCANAVPPSAHTTTMIEIQVFIESLPELQPSWHQTCRRRNF